MPRTIAAVMSSGMATLAEMQTVYGIEDVYLMLEVITVDSHNRRIARGNS